MNRIVNESCKTLKALARQTLKSCWQEAVVFLFVCQLLLQLPTIIYELIPEGADKIGIIASAVNLYSYLVASITSLAASRYFINVFRQKDASLVNDMKFGFNNFVKALWLYIRITIITSLLSLLFIIPGIIASINYSQAFNIMADNPEKSPAQCMIESKFIMRGNRIKFVLLLLSFAGWYLLSLAPAWICQSMLVGDPLRKVEALFAQGDYYGAVAAGMTKHPLVSLLELLMVFPLAYLDTAEIAFFDILVGKLSIQNVDEIKFEAVHNDTEGETPQEEQPEAEAEYEEETSEDPIQQDDTDNDETDDNE